ncbi:MAG TPA: hypothetical protein VFT43_10770, partial [Candidatus Polarisedimenticolia bacterium]|nr:hypothetical protein [Candidatus Polarisedimenticolia bacterium]
RIARAADALRRLSYFRDLLVEGFRSARDLDLFSNSLRGERLALGIDLPELDAVGLWSARAGDGSLSIPFIEYILGQIVTVIDTFCADLDDRRANGELLAERQALDEALHEANRGGPTALALPHLGDNFLPEPFLARLCVAGGLIDRTVEACRGLLRG